MNTSLLTMSLIWLGAGISIAEIMTGTYFAPLGFEMGMAAILLGHIIGCFLLFLASSISALRSQSAMQSAKMSFGKLGGAGFATLNVIQLLGWTSIMIYDAALAGGGLWGTQNWGWSLLVGGLIVLWLCLDLKKVGVLNSIAVVALFGLTLVLGLRVFSSDGALAQTSDALSFGAAVELSAAMPLSWLPLIGDYTMRAKRPLIASAISSLSYGVVSCWMYAVGMAAAIYGGGGNIVQILLASGLGVGALAIVVLSTVTTTFLDAYSAGVSANAISKRLSVKSVGVGVAIIGTVTAICFKMDDITEFLYLIGSVFAPMAAILIADFFILKQDFSELKLNWVNLTIWLAGFGLYRAFLDIDTPLGSTLPVMMATVLLCVLTHSIRRVFIKRV